MNFKEITFEPAFDKRNSDPTKNYGIHGVNVRFLYGDKNKGVVQFLLYTNWHLPNVRSEAKNDPSSIVAIERYPFEFWQAPMPADLGFHSPHPQYEDQYKMDSCDVLNQGFCYYDGSGLNAQRTFETLIEKGSEGVWKELEEYWKKLFT
jgi:hypothetical protein